MASASASTRAKHSRPSFDAVAAGDVPDGLEELIVIERNVRRAERFGSIVATLFPDELRIGIPVAGAQANDVLRVDGWGLRRQAARVRCDAVRGRDVGRLPLRIENATRSAGLLVERADLTTFTGDVTTW